MFVPGFSSFGERGLLSSCRVRASRCSGFSCGDCKDSDMTKQPSMRKYLLYVHVGSAEEGAVVFSLSGTDVNGER